MTTSELELEDSWSRLMNLVQCSAFHLKWSFISHLSLRDRFELNSYKTLHCYCTRLSPTSSQIVSFNLELVRFVGVTRGCSTSTISWIVCEVLPTNGSDIIFMEKLFTRACCFSTEQHFSTCLAFTKSLRKAHRLSCCRRLRTFSLKG